MSRIQRRNKSLTPPARAALAALLLTGMIGCDAPERSVVAGTEAREANSVPAAGAEAGVAEPGAGQRATVLFLGTSLSAGYGLPAQQSYPARVQQKIDSAGLPFRVVNAGVSGETSAGARRRIDWLLRQPFQVLVLETGANDMLRGAELDSTRANIQAIIDRVRAERPDTRIVLAGMLAPPNLGQDYAREFGQIYPELAERNDLALIPFLLDGVGGEPELNLPDGIHPNERGQRIVAGTVWNELEPVLRAEAAEPSATP